MANPLFYISNYVILITIIKLKNYVKKQKASLMRDYLYIKAFAL